MNKDEVLTELSKIYADVTNEKAFQLEHTCIISQIPGWDSLANIQIVIQVEDNLGVKFTTKDLTEFKTVEDFCTAVVSKSAG